MGGKRYRKCWGKACREYCGRSIGRQSITWTSTASMCWANNSSVVYHQWMASRAVVEAKAARAYPASPEDNMHETGDREENTYFVEAIRPEIQRLSIHDTGEEVGRGTLFAMRTSNSFSTPATSSV